MKSTHNIRLFLAILTSAVSNNNVVEAATKKLSACINAYPGTESDIAGRIVVRIDTETNDLTYAYKLVGVEADVTGGTHIHSGTTCDDASLVGGHYWNAGVNGTDPDPWTPEYGAIYETTSEGTSRGEFTLNSGYGFDENKGHAVVIHASDGSRVGCGVLAGPGMTGPCGATGFGPEKLQACVTSYPGTENDVEGKVVVTFDEDGDLTYKFYGVRDLEVSAVGGTHIHTGTTCDDASLVGGHYWDTGVNGTDPDPWTAEYGAVYETNVGGDARGSFTLNSGYGYEENAGHAVVVHDSTGARVGCGVLGKGKTGPCF